MNLKELKEKIDALIDEYEEESGLEFEDDSYDAYLEPEEEPLPYQPPSVQQYFSPALQILVIEKGEAWKESFRNCSIRLYGGDADCKEEKLLGYNDQASMDGGADITIVSEGTLSVFEVVSAQNPQLYFGGTMGEYGHFMQVSNRHVDLKTHLRTDSVNIDIGGV